jgi:hypothetical protein
MLSICRHVTAGLFWLQNSRALCIANLASIMPFLTWRTPLMVG